LHFASSPVLSWLVRDLWAAVNSTPRLGVVAVAVAVLVVLVVDFVNGSNPSKWTLAPR